MFKLSFKGLAAAVALIVCSIFTSPVAAAYDIEVQQFADPAIAVVGETVTFNITLTNNGPDASERGDLVFQTSGITQWRGIVEVTFSDNVPEDVTWGWSQAGGDQRIDIYDLPSLATGEFTLIQVMMQAHHGGTLETTAQYVLSVDAPTEDTNLDNNQAVITTSIVETQFDLGVTYSTSTDYVQAGSLLVVDYHITNHGPDNCPDVRFAIKKSPFIGDGIRHDDMELLSILDAPSWTFEEDHVYMSGLLTPIMSGRFSSLGPGQSTTVTALYLVWGNGAYDWAFHRYAEVSSPVGTDLNNSNDRAFFQIPYADASMGTDLEIARSVPAEVGVNQQFTYTLHAVNRGSNPASNAYIGTLIPENFQVLAVASDKGTATAVDNYVSLENAYLAGGEAATVHVTVTPSTIGEVALVSGVVSDGFDSNLGNNHIADVVRITEFGPHIPEPVPCANAPDLVSHLTKVKRVGKFKKKQGEWEFTVTAQVQVRNIGTASAPKSPVWFFLSENTVLDASDILIGGKTVSGMKAGKQKKVKFKTKLPGGLNPVGYYVIAVADGENLVAECDETNNSSVVY